MNGKLTEKLEKKLGKKLKKQVQKHLHKHPPKHAATAAVIETAEPVIDKKERRIRRIKKAEKLFTRGKKTVNFTNKALTKLAAILAFGIGAFNMVPKILSKFGINPEKG